MLGMLSDRNPGLLSVCISLFLPSLMLDFFQVPSVEACELVTAHLQLARQALKENPDASDTEKEYAELKVQLNQVVETINEHLEEIRYGAADLF
ncbi:unnamed protein product [Darwinula stevensoni]|uniref:Uncharacterized protein n=1 Tax=Darwinula stevensoni TaxID=69355 RepID=A0A7R9A788_9CRUS|nr:unnamed protein product [Darwinula stevensoni]CAG0892140.1 unnamed protein product [Darwinula stevensoni]